MLLRAILLSTPIPCAYSTGACTPLRQDGVEIPGLKGVVVIPTEVLRTHLLGVMQMVFLLLLIGNMWVLHWVSSEQIHYWRGRLPPHVLNMAKLILVYPMLHLSQTNLRIKTRE